MLRIYTSRRWGVATGKTINKAFASQKRRSEGSDESKAEIEALGKLFENVRRAEM